MTPVNVADTVHRDMRRHMRSHEWLQREPAASRQFVTCVAADQRCPLCSRPRFSLQCVACHELDVGSGHPGVNMGHASPEVAAAAASVVRNSAGRPTFLGADGFSRYCGAKVRGGGRLACARKRATHLIGSHSRSEGAATGPVASTNVTGSAAHVRAAT